MDRRTSNHSRVHFIGFEGAVKHTLEYFFVSHRVGKQYKIVDSPSRADWVIFNADQPSSKSTLKSYLEEKVGLPALLISVSELEWNNCITVIKPFTANALAEGIEALQKQIQASIAPETSDLDRYLAEQAEAERLEAERLEAERLEAERLEAERLEAERLEAERLEAERLEAERLEAERLEAERLEAERLEAERLEAERLEAERLEAERLEAERLEAERLEAERLEAERLEAERLEAERLEAERLEAERLEAERLEAERLEAERLEAERLEAERLEAERLEAERLEAERLEAERLEAERLEAERLEAERLEAEHLEAERLEAERLEAEQKPKSNVADLQLAAKKRALLLAKKKALLKKEGVNTPDPTGTSGVRSTASIDSIGHGGGPHLGARVSNVRAQVVAKLAESSPSQSKPVVTPEVFDQIVPALKPAIEKKQAQYNEALISKPTPQKATNMVSVFGNLPELDWTIEADRRRLLINLEGMLLPWIQKIVEKGRSQRTSLAIDGLHLRLEYLPWTDCFVTNLSEEVLYTVMTSRFGLGELSMKPGDVIEDDLQEGLGFSERVITAEDLLWLAGLWTVQGRVLPADDPSRTRRLTRSPDCIRDIVIPEVHAVINLWQTRPMTAFQVISELNIPQRFVFGVMAAATTAQLFAY